jgi:hypothetical protein
LERNLLGADLDFGYGGYHPRAFLARAMAAPGHITAADIRPGSRLSPLTLVGWLTLIKAAMFVVLPSAKLVALYSGVSAAHILISGSLTLLLGLYLTVSGFRAPLEKSKY